MNSIRLLQRQNCELEDKLRALGEKYATLADICIENGGSLGERNAE